MIGFSIYALSVAVVYLLIRWSWRRLNPRWTVGDRTRSLVFAALTPIGLAAIVAALLEGFDSDKEAKW